MDEFLTTTDQELRERAVKHLKKVRDFHTHALVYVLVNTFVVIVWALTGAETFWPIFLIGFWGIGLAMNAYDVYFSGDLDEAKIEREMQRMRHQV